MPKSFHFDPDNRFVIEGFDAVRPFASFLPGIAGPLGLPMWLFYVNRGQAVASFGVESKDTPILEFLPANKAYQATPYVGFRTFLKLDRGQGILFYEPFAPGQAADSNRMFIGMNELEIQAIHPALGLQINVLYFTLPGEPFAGLVRQVTLKNLGETPLSLELLDGMPRVMPFGVDNWGLKEIGRTMEAWMGVFNLEQGIPFYRVLSGAGDEAELAEIRAGHFYLAFCEEAGRSTLLPAFVDPARIFGQNTTLSTPDRFIQHSLDRLREERQVTTGRTPCGFFGLQAILEPGQSQTLHAIIGHVGNAEQLPQLQGRLARGEYLRQKRGEANQLVHQLTSAVDTHTGNPTFDAYCRQTFLDNILRGGWPLLLGPEENPFVYHVYSRKHGDLERDYNAFHLAAEMYSQGNGNYRDVNQNRRCDVLLEPRVGDFNVLSFLGLLQADGYNPLVVLGSRFTVPAEHRAAILELLEQPEPLTPLLAGSFTPGQLLKAVNDRQLGLTVTPEALVTAALAQAEQHFEAEYATGYWIDHWFYNLDQIEAYLSVFPDKKRELLFEKRVPYFGSPAFVQPRARKYVLAGDKVRQYGAVREDNRPPRSPSRTGQPNLVRTAAGQIFQSTVFDKLVGLALLKFATMDPLGMGIEMEAGRPGWYDALNGLPGLFGSSLCETYELERLLTLLLEAGGENPRYTARLPVEQVDLLQAVSRELSGWESSPAPDRDYCYWDAVASAREVYRERVRLGFSGETRPLPWSGLALLLADFRRKVRAGIQRAVAMNDGLPPTYFAYTVTDYEWVADGQGTVQRDERGRPYVRAKRFAVQILPLFLEGPVHALRVQENPDSARQLYRQVRASALLDRKLQMYKVNAPLDQQTHEIGRARAFTPGWLENESIWLHMEYKYLLATLQAGLDEEFLHDFRQVLIPFQDPATYGRSPLENSSFLVSSAHPDESLHGAGFVARLSGSTAEFLSIWSIMMAGKQPFSLQDGQLQLAFRPVLPGWLFDETGLLYFTFLGQVRVAHHNPSKTDLLDRTANRVTLHTRDQQAIELPSGVIAGPYAEMVRLGQVEAIDVFWD